MCSRSLSEAPMAASEQLCLSTAAGFIKMCSGSMLRDVLYLWICKYSRGTTCPPTALHCIIDDMHAHDATLTACNFLAFYSAGSIHRHWRVILFGGGHEEGHGQPATLRFNRYHLCMPSRIALPGSHVSGHPTTSPHPICLFAANWHACSIQL